MFGVIFYDDSVESCYTDVSHTHIRGGGVHLEYIFSVPLVFLFYFICQNMW